MAISDSQKVDLLYKKLFGVAKTDTSTNKSPSNEATSSPFINRGDKIWVQANSIPTTAASTAGIVQAYQTTSAVQTTADNTTTPVGGVYPTWKTSLTDWIPPEFGATYFISAYAGTTGLSDPTTGVGATKIFDSGSGGTGEWFFDYQAGVLNFIGTTIPAPLTSANTVYITGYRYIGQTGISSISANTIYTQGVDATQNTRLTVIEGTDVSQNARMTIIENTDVSQNVRLDYSNTAITIIQGVDSGQNARMTIIEGTDVSQNARMVIIEATDVSQNARMTVSDGVNSSQNVRIDYSNTAITIIQGVDVTQNANISYAWAQANLANSIANTALQNTTSIFTAGNLTVANNLIVANSITTSGSGGNISGVNIVYANTFNAAVSYIFADGTIQTTAGSSVANTIYLQGALNAANANIAIIQGTDVGQNSRMTIIEGVDTSQNARMTIIEGVDTSQNARMTIIEGTDVSQNARMTIIEGTDVSQNVRLDYSNSLITIIQGTDSSQNARMAIIEGVDVTQNTNISNKLSLTGANNQTVSGNVTISQDLIVAGNFILTGNINSQNVQQLSVADPLIILGIGNYLSDTKDIGFAGHYNDGTNAHAGLIRDSGTKEFYVFQGYTPELDANNNVIITDTSFRTANLNANYVKGNLIATTAVVNGIDLSTYTQATYAQANVTIGVDAGQNTRLTVIEGTDASQNVRLDYSNSLITIIQGTDVGQNARMTIIEGTDTSQNARMVIIEGTDTSQNARMTIIEGTDVGQNSRMTIIEGVNSSQNVRLDYSNTAITIIQGVDTSQNANIALLQTGLNSANANIAIIQGVDSGQNSRMTIIEGTDTSQNARMTIIEGTDVGQNARMTIIEGTDTSQNVRLDYSNTAITIIQGVDVGQNSRMTIIEGTDTSQNARMTIIEGVDVWQNTAITLLQSSLITINSNSAYSSAIDLSQNANIALLQFGLNSANANIISLQTLANTDYTTLSTTAGVYGNSTFVPVVTLAANGRITSITNTAITVSGGGGGTSNWAVKTTTYTAVNGDKLVANTAGGTFTITLPATPSAGHSVEIADGADWSTINLTVARNGSTIEGLAEDVTMNVKSADVIFVYDGTTWQAYASFVPTGTTILNDTTSSNTNYLTMATANSGVFSTAYISDSKLYYIPSTGTLSTTNFNSLSDLTLKENVINIVDGLGIVSKINPVQFTWKDNKKKSFGVIAQEIEKILPELVQENDIGIKSVSYVQIIPLLVQAIKELKEEIEILKGK